MIAGLLASAGYVALLPVLGHRVLRRRPGTAFLLVLWIIVGLVLVTVVGLTAAEPIREVVTSLAVYLFVVEVFVFVAAISFGSLSARILVGTLVEGSGASAFEETLKRYSPSVFFNHRLGRLVDQGLLVQDGELLHVTARGRRWARAASLLKRLLAVGPGG